MKKVLLFISLLFISGVAVAAPSSTFSATAPTLYVDGTSIPTTDILGYTLWCGNTAGGAYLHFYDVPNLISGTVVDVSSCVQGIPGTYYFVATATSSTFGTTSTFSLEILKTYTVIDLGKIPFAPTLLTVQ